MQFERAVDVPNAGVVLALPALLAMGLLRHTERFFRWSQGYYGITSIFVLLAFLALARVRSPEKLPCWTSVCLTHLAGRILEMG